MSMIRAAAAAAGALVVLAIAAPASSQQQLPVDPPARNVVIIIMDDVGVDQINVYMQGYLDPEYPEYPMPCTPNIDALAERGTRFTNAWVNPLCSPTRSMILTGQPALHTGIGNVTNPLTDLPGLDSNTFTVAKLVDNSLALGKWHLADETEKLLLDGHPIASGFDEFKGVFYNLTEFPQDGPSYYDWQLWSLPGSSTSTTQSVYHTVSTTTAAITFLEEFELDPSPAPFLLWVAYSASHEPFHCPAGAECPLEGTCSEDWCAECKFGMGPYDNVTKTRAMTQAMDAQIGRLLAEVGRCAPNTAVILIGDNGTPGHASVEPFTSAHAKQTVYQGGINVPLIIAVPDGSGRVSHELASGTDIFATVADFLSEETNPIPEDPFGLRDSISLVHYVDPQTYGAPPEKRSHAYSEYFTPNFRPDSEGNPPSDYAAKVHRRALRNKTHKLIEQHEHGGTTVEFYRLCRDLDATLPEDPSTLDDDPVDEVSAFETFDLLENPSVWTTQDHLAYTELCALLDDEYPALPIKGVAFPTQARTATQLCDPGPPAICDDSLIELGVTPSTKGRAFLEFEVGPNVCGSGNLARAYLEVGVRLGSDNPNTSIKIVGLNGADGANDVSSYSASCGELFGAASSTVYAGPVTGWENSGVVSIQLNDNGKAALSAALAGDKRFSVALLLEDESCGPDQRVGLNPVFGGQWSHHRLKVVCPEVPPQSVELPFEPSVQQDPSEVPARGSGQNYPNPFNPSTTISYAVPEPSTVTLQVFDAAGRLVRTLVAAVQAQGSAYQVVWDGRNDAGHGVPSGVYFYQLRIGDFTDTKKMMLLK